MIFKLELGTKVRDRTSGFEGTIVARTEFLYGCIRYTVEALIGGDLKAFVFDEDGLINLADPEGLGPEKKKRAGGARAAIPRTGH